MKTISLLVLWFSPEFWCSIISAVTEHTRNQIFLMSYPKIFSFKIFPLVLLDGFLDGFSNFWLFIVKICILMWYFSKIIACVCWAYVETILSNAEHTLNRFHRTLSIRGTNFRACSARGKMWTVFTCTIRCWAYAEQILSHTEHMRNEFHRVLSIHRTDFIACWACTEMLKSWISRPNRIRFSKISCYRPLGPYGFGFCKKSF